MSLRSKSINSMTINERFVQLEPILPIAFCLYGIVILSFQESTLWEWSAVLIIGALGIWGLSGWISFKNAISSRAIIISAATWFLVLSTGDSGNFFLLWHVALIATYPFLLPRRIGRILIVGIILGYIILIPISPRTVPLSIAVYRELLIIFIGVIQQAISTVLSQSTNQQKAIADEFKYRSLLLGSISDSIIATTLDFKIQSWNSAAENLYGWKSEEVIGKGVNEILNTKYLTDNYEAVRAEFQNKGHWNGEVIQKTKDGQDLYILASVNLVLNDSGEPTAVLAVNRDLSEGKRVKKALDKSIQQYQILMEQSNDAVFILHFDGQHIDANQRAADMLGYSLKEVKELSAWDISTEIDASSQKLDLIKSGEHIPIFTRLFKKKSGEIFPVEINIQLIEGVHGESQYIMSIVRDITERKRIEGELSASEAKYRNLFENLPIPVFTKDVEGRYLSSNKKNQEFWTNSPLGKTGAELLDPALAAKIRAVDLYVMNTGMVTTNEEQITHTTDGQRTVLSRKMPLRDSEGNILGVLGAGIDITDLKVLEGRLQQSEKMTAIGQLAAGIAHDFNNQLAVIKLSSALIELSTADDDLINLKAKRISAASNMAGSLIKQLMAFSRKQIVSPVILDLNVDISRIKEVLRRIIGEHISLKTILLPELWMAKIDPIQVEQIILNLAVNARDAMPKGGELVIQTDNLFLKAIHLARNIQLEPGEYVSISFSDNGEGIDASNISRIFEPFFTTKGENEGTGLGLSTVYGIVKQNDGDIEVSSEKEIGTTITIYLPRNKGKRHLDPPQTIPHVQISGSETVLLVEDEEEVRKVICEVLQMHGYSVIEAYDGENALNLVSNPSTNFDILVTDLIMPGMSGGDLAQRINKDRPKTKVLFMSGYTDDVISHYGILDEGVNFLQKPFDPQSLLLKIRAILKTS